MQFKTIWAIAWAGASLAWAGIASAAEPKGAQPLGNPGEWVTTPDYPTEAMQDNLEGAVGFLLKIDTSGRVESCTVTQSSGADILDNAACNLITLRARFAPAADARGRPTIGSYASRVRWVLPKDGAQPFPVDLEYTFIVDIDGSINDCRLIRLEGLTAEQKAKGGSPCPNAVTTTPYLDDAGEPVRRRVRVLMKTSIEPIP